MCNLYCAQVIAYKEWLPKILGESGMQQIGSYDGYNKKLDASLSNEFATAAFRFGHGLIRPIMPRLKEDLTPIDEGNLDLHKTFFAPYRVLNEGT